MFRRHKQSSPQPSDNHRTRHSLTSDELDSFFKAADSRRADDVPNVYDLDRALIAVAKDNPILAMQARQQLVWLCHKAAPRYLKSNWRTPWQT